MDLGRWDGDARRGGCEELRERAEALAPLLHLFGRAHDAGGFWQPGPTALSNLTIWEGDRAPTAIEVDPSSRPVMPVVAPPARGGAELEVRAARGDRSPGRLR